MKYFLPSWGLSCGPAAPYRMPYQVSYQGCIIPHCFHIMDLYLSQPHTLNAKERVTFQKKFAALAAAAVLVSPFLPQNSNFWNFCQKIITLTRTVRRGYEISPLLNVLYFLLE